jgi:hypothetical protein
MSSPSPKRRAETDKADVTYLTSLREQEVAR